MPCMKPPLIWPWWPTGLMIWPTSWAVVKLQQLHLAGLGVDLDLGDLGGEAGDVQRGRVSLTVPTADDLAAGAASEVLPAHALAGAAACDASAVVGRARPRGHSSCSRGEFAAAPP